MTVNLVDSQFCNDPGKYLSVAMMSLSTMVFLETPHINVLSKIDLINNLTPLGIITGHMIIIVIDNYCILSSFWFGLLY